jgi:hypothetical protein
VASRKVRLDDGGHPTRRRSGRKEAEIFAVAIHQIDEAGMVDGVLDGAIDYNLGVIDPVGSRSVADMRRVAREPEQAGRALQGRNRRDADDLRLETLRPQSACGERSSCFVHRAWLVCNSSAAASIISAISW